MRSRVRRLVVATAAIAAGALLALPTGAGAATIVVPRTDDEPNGGFGDEGCTLRDAVQAANTNSSHPLGCVGDNAGADTIVLQGGKTYSLDWHGVDDTNAAGDLDVTGPLTIRSSGPGLATINGASNTLPGQPIGADRTLHVLASAGDVTLEGIRVEGGFVAHSAPAMGGGGGIRTESLLTLRRSEVVNNRVEGSTYILGGGIWAHGPTARVRIFDSTIAGNSILKQGEHALGGGIATYPNATELTIENSTIANNKAEGGFAEAGGIFGGDYLNSALSTLTNVTVTGNSAENAGGIWLRGTLTGSLLAGNSATRPDALFEDCLGSVAITSGGGNLIGQARPGDYCSFGKGDLVGTEDAPINPNLGTLVNNGGPTRTLAPNTGSPALNRGGTCPPTDQRGLFRFAGGVCDAGAVELGASPTPPPPPPAPPAAIAAPPTAAAPGPTGRRAAAMARCGKLKRATRQKTRQAKQRCRNNAKKLPL